MNIRAAKAGLRIQEIPSFERPRLHGESNLSAIGDGWRILRLIAQEKFSWLGRRLIAAPPAAGVSGPVGYASGGQDERGRRMSQLSVSVVICAHADDRWDDTLAAAASVRGQSHPAKELIIVVDYNRPLYERLRTALPDAVVLENRDRQGLSGGRNTGIAASTGEVIAFLDDDAVADVNWLKCLVDAYTDPSVAGVGGLTRPAWDTERPAWFPQEFDWVIGCTYIGMPTRRAPVRNVLGGNASFRRDVFEQVGGFISGIGRDRGKRPLGCEETEFCIRLRQRMPGAVLLFDEQAIIWHRVRGHLCARQRSLG